jgi:ABC-type transport system involved in multi-copper enzyme maturation permease subunit
MVTYGLAVIAYVTLPSLIAESRERGALLRLAGTPMPRWSYLAGRVTGALAVAAVTALALFAVAIVGYGVRLEAGRLPAAVVAFLLAVCCFAALGLALLALLRGAQTAGLVHQLDVVVHLGPVVTQEQQSHTSIHSGHDRYGEPAGERPAT